MFGVLWDLGCSGPCCWVQNGWFFSEADFDFFFFYSCVWQNVVERLLQSACSPWLEGAVSASERPRRRRSRWPYKPGVVLTSVRRVTGQFSWLGVYRFRARGGHQTLVSPSSHQDGRLQEQNVYPPARAEILLHLLFL